jgi:hypothetical protein
MHWSPNTNNPRLHGGMRTVLPHAPVLAHEAKHQRVRRAQMGGVEVSAGRHKSACRSTRPEREDQQALRNCGSEGRRWLQACSTCY